MYDNNLNITVLPSAANACDRDGWGEASSHRVLTYTNNLQFIVHMFCDNCAGKNVCSFKLVVECHVSENWLKWRS